MWGVDKQNKTSQEALKERDCTLSFVRNATSPVTSENILQKQIHLQKLVKTISHNIHSHSRAEFFLNKRFTKMQATNPSNPIHYQCVLGAIHVKTADCKNVICHTLELNLDVCRLISQLKSLPDANHAQVANHIRRMHDGVCISCKLCPKHFWAGKGFEDHIKSAHSQQVDEWYEPEANLSNIKAEPASQIE